MESSRTEDGAVFDHGPRSVRGAGREGYNTLKLVKRIIFILILNKMKFELINYPLKGCLFILRSSFPTTALSSPLFISFILSIFGTYFLFLTFNFYNGHVIKNNFFGGTPTYHCHLA